MGIFLSLASITVFLLSTKLQVKPKIEEVSLIKSTEVYIPSNFFFPNPLFPGKQGKQYREFLSQYRIDTGFDIEKECSRRMKKQLRNHLKLALRLYYDYKGRTSSLRKKSDSRENQEKMSHNYKICLEIENNLEKLLSQMFRCILANVTRNYKNLKIRSNRYNYTITSCAYYSAMKKIEDFILESLETTLLHFTYLRDYREKVSEAEFKNPNCSSLSFSIQVIKSSIITETSRRSRYKKNKKKCKSFIRSRFLKN
ncbi:hypothetical protein HWI79_310 [Cryptosporidium felis]|nr:hypothetical protein HWI79_310 [Cryptosporidium felis]